MPKRIAIIGAQAYAMLNFRGLLIEEMRRRGVEVHALAADYTDADRQEIARLGGAPVDNKIDRTGRNIVRDFLSILDMRRTLHKIRPDIAFSYMMKPVIYGTLAAKLAGVPKTYAMIEGLGHIFIAKPSLKSRAMKALSFMLYKTSLSLADKTLFLNEDDRSDFVNAGLVKREKTEVVGAIGIDLSAWNASAPITDPVTFLFVGRLLREKGLAEFIAAVRTVRRSHPEARFVLLGEVDSNPSSFASAEVRQWVDAGLVEWPGHVDVKPWIERSSVFVLPSYREGVPKSTQEAMAMARAVITTDVPGCRETVEHGRNGLLVPAKNSDALADAMLQFIEKPDLIASMGQESRTMAEEKFDVRKANARVLAAIGLTGDEPVNGAAGV